MNNIVNGDKNKWYHKSYNIDNNSYYTKSQSTYPWVTRKFFFIPCWDGEETYTLINIHILMQWSITTNQSYKLTLKLLIEACVEVGF